MYYCLVIPSRIADYITVELQHKDVSLLFLIVCLTRTHRFSGLAREHAIAVLAAVTLIPNLISRTRA